MSLVVVISPPSKCFHHDKICLPLDYIFQFSVEAHAMCVCVAGRCERVHVARCPINIARCASGDTVGDSQRSLKRPYNIELLQHSTTFVNRIRNIFILHCWLAGWRAKDQRRLTTKMLIWKIIAECVIGDLCAVKRHANANCPVQHWFLITIYSLCVACFVFFFSLSPSLPLCSIGLSEAHVWHVN